MIIGVLADTHYDRQGAMPHIIEEFKKRNVEIIVHCGDIIPEHVNRGAFGSLPVVCALVEGQEDDPVYEKKRPRGWRFTRPGKRIVKLGNGREQLIVYVGHKRHLDYLRATEAQFNEVLSDLRQSADGLRMVFGGHLHFQTFKQGPLVSFVNPGAVEGALGWGYEFAVVDTQSEQVVFSRILPTPDDRTTFSIGVIADSLDITHRDAGFWGRLAREFHERDVSHVIHCGNLALTDIGQKAFEGFTVHYSIRADQRGDHRELKRSSRIPDNWRVIAEENLDDGAVVNVNGYRFYVRLDLGLEFRAETEVGIDALAMNIRRKHPETEFVLCGFTRDALLVEGQQVMIINPGDINVDRSFAVVCLPRREITYSHVPFNALAPLPQKDR